MACELNRRKFLRRARAPLGAPTAYGTSGAFARVPPRWGYLGPPAACLQPVPCATSCSRSQASGLSFLLWPGPRACRHTQDQPGRALHCCCDSCADSQRASCNHLQLSAGWRSRTPQGVERPHQPWAVTCPLLPLKRRHTLSAPRSEYHQAQRTMKHCYKHGLRSLSGLQHAAACCELPG